MPSARIGVVIHTPLRNQLFSAEDQTRLERAGSVAWADAERPLTVDAARALLAGCSIGIGSWGSPYPSAELLDGLPELRCWIHAAGTVKHMFGPHLEGRELTIASCKTAIADCVAEMVLAEIILGLRGVFPNAAANRNRAAPNPQGLRVLFGATVGVVGASEVGRRVVRLLQPFRCRTLVYDPTLTPAAAVELNATIEPDLLALCAASDVVTLHTPDIPACRGLLGAAEFAAMRPDTIFINSSRGACIDQAALTAELERGRLFAFLDVTEPEPAPVDSPLRRLGNVVLTSHIAGPATFNLGRQAVEDAEAFLSGEQPACVVTAGQLETSA